MARPTGTSGSRAAASGSGRRDAASAAVAVRALQLLGRWGRVARGHIALGAGCGCGFGGMIGVTVADFEPEVLDFLHERFARGEPAIADLFASIGFRDGAGGSIEALLGALARSGIASKVAAPLLDQLETSIGSFEAVHGGGRG
jgi:hypothetical protein